MHGYLKGYGFLGDAWDKIKSGAESAHEFLKKNKFASATMATLPFISAVANPASSLVLHAPKILAAAAATKHFLGYGDVK